MGCRSSREISTAITPAATSFQPSAPGSRAPSCSVTCSDSVVSAVSAPTILRTSLAGGAAPTTCTCRS